MITKQKIKDDIDKIKDADLIVVHRIVQALVKSPSVEVSGKSESEQDWIKFVNHMYGCLSDDPISRGHQGEFESREIIE